jgi:gliding motility-associated-like protein
MMLYPQNPTNPTIQSLAGYVSDILGATQATGFTVSIYTTQALAMAGVASTAIQNLSTYQVQTGTYWVRVENDVTKCYILDDFNVTIEKLVKPNITPLNGRDTICVKWGTNTVIPGSEVTLDSGIPVGSPVAAYSYQWYYNTGTALVAIPGATSQTYTIQGTPTYLSGDYSVVVTSLSTLACPSEPSNVFTVKKSGPVLIGVPEYFVSNAFADNQTVTVNYLGGFGVYEYSLDGGPWQSSPVFESVPFGSHSIEIKDVASPIYSCSTPPIEGIYTIDFPHFFTPNGDGQNDTWNISGLSNQSDAKIYIFDRYGKLVKQISSCNGCGWDGTFVGKPLPADDYWFTVEFAEDTNTRIFKSHFTLKR